MQIAYYFPPVGGAGAQRSLKFVRYLPESGCRSVVVTGTGGTTGRWTPSDETLSDEIPDGTSLLRIGGAEPAGPTRLAWAHQPVATHPLGVVTLVDARDRRDGCRAQTRRVST